MLQSHPSISSLAGSANPCKAMAKLHNNINHTSEICSSSSSSIVLPSNLSKLFLEMITLIYFFRRFMEIFITHLMANELIFFSATLFVVLIIPSQCHHDWLPPRRDDASLALFHQ